jgi:hypothetical protein
VLFAGAQVITPLKRTGSDQRDCVNLSLRPTHEAPTACARPSALAAATASRADDVSISLALAV